MNGAGSAQMLMQVHFNDAHILAVMTATKVYPFDEFTHKRCDRCDGSLTVSDSCRYER